MEDYMRISPEQHKDIQRLLELASGSVPLGQQGAEDAEKLRSALSLDADGNPQVDFSRGLYRAFTRLVKGRPGFDDLQGLLQRVRVFEGPQWDISTFRWLYDNSPTLRSISDEVLVSPEALAKELLKIRPEIEREMSLLKEKNTKYALSTFVQALKAGGRIAGDIRGHIQTANALDLYSRSSLLQQIDDGDLVTPEKLVETIVRLRPAIVEEQRIVREVDDNDLQTYSLATILQALIVAGRIRRKIRDYMMYASGREFYENSTVLQNIDDEYFETPVKLFERLLFLMPQIVEERRALGKSGFQADGSYALGTLVQALVGGGKIKADGYLYVLLAYARSLFERSPILQSIPAEDLSSPQRLFHKLASLRESIAEEQRQIGSDFDEEFSGYSLSYLVSALKAGGKIDDERQRFTRMATAYDLYSRSPILQGINDEDLKTPALLLERLISLKADICTEQNRSDYSLTTLIAALSAGGRIPGKHVNLYLRMGGGRELYDRSSILQGISDSDLETPQKLIDRLASLKSEITEELHEIRDAAGDDVTDYSLTYIVFALVASGRLNGKHEPYWRLAASRDFYERSPILQSIDDSDLATPEKTVAVLASLRPRIIEEQRDVRGVGEELAGYALGTLVQALRAGGRIKSSAQMYERLAGGFDLYERSPILQGISDADLETPVKLLKKLVSSRPDIVEEQRKARGQEGGSSESYALSTLVQALEAGGRITKNKQTYERIAAGYELYKRSPLLQSISSEDVATPERLAERLVSLRSRIVEEQRQVRGVDEATLGSYSLGTLVDALEAGGKLRGDLNLFKRVVIARDLYERSPILKGISDADLETPDKLLAKLIILRPAVVEEQRQVRGVDADQLENYSMPYLVHALCSGGRIKRAFQSYARVAGAYDIFNKSPTLQNFPRHMLADDESLIKFLLTRRDRIAVEIFAARDELEQGQFVFPDSEKYYSLITLTETLRAGGLIDEKRRNKIARQLAYQLEYFTKCRDVIETAIRALGDRYISRTSIDFSLFRSIKDPTRELSRISIGCIIRSARWFLSDRNTAVRSIYYADEMAGLVLFSLGELLKHLPQEISDWLEFAGEEGHQARLSNDWPAMADARRVVVETLKNLTDEAAHGLDSDLQTRFAEGLRQVKRLIEWNKDALKDPPSSEKPDGGPAPDGSSQGSTPAPQIFNPAASAAIGAAHCIQVAPSPPMQIPLLSMTAIMPGVMAPAML